MAKRKQRKEVPPEVVANMQEALAHALRVMGLGPGGAGKKRAGRSELVAPQTSAKPFTFVWDEDCWVSTAKLSSWAGFQNRTGHYGALGSRKASDGTVRIVFAPEGRGEEELNSEERRLIDQFIKKEPEISKSLLAQLVKEYPGLQAQYGYTGREKKELMPDIRSEADLRPLVGLHTVHIHQVSKNGVPYTGYEFGCTWDDEHGLGILMHGTRLVEIGGADTAFLLWIAKKDAKHA